MRNHKNDFRSHRQICISQVDFYSISVGYVFILTIYYIEQISD